MKGMCLYVCVYGLLYKHRHSVKSYERAHMGGFKTSEMVKF